MGHLIIEKEKTPACLPSFPFCCTFFLPFISRPYFSLLSFLLPSSGVRDRAGPGEALLGFPVAIAAATPFTRKCFPEGVWGLNLVGPRACKEAGSGRERAGGKGKCWVWNSGVLGPGLERDRWVISQLTLFLPLIIQSPQTPQSSTYILFPRTTVQNTHASPKHTYSRKYI